MNVLLALIAVLLMVVCATTAHVTQASAASCHERYPGTSPYSGYADAKNDTYDVYVKLPKRGQQASVSVYRELLDKNGSLQCTSSKSVKASGDTWTKVARWTIDDENISAYLASKELAETYGANRPQLLLISATHPVCSPSTNCAITIAGQQGSIIPVTEATDENELTITIPHVVENDKLEEVNYYVDNVPMYTTSTLKDFDMRFVSFANQHLVRLLTYASGQQIILESNSPITYSDNFGNFIFRLVYLNPSSSKTLAIAGTLVLLIAAARYIWLLVTRRRNWRINHGFLKSTREPTRTLSVEDLENNYERSLLRSRLKKGFTALCILAAACLLVITTTRYAVTLNQVNGVSMQETIKDRAWLIVNRLPVTWGNIINKQYVPARGDIVTINEVYGHQSPKEENQEHRQLVKRVIGLPGERITIRHGRITIYNKTHPDGFNPDANAPWSKSMIADLSSDTLDLHLLANEVFVIGDNRLVSVDSRMNGPIAISNIQGVLVTPLSF